MNRIRSGRSLFHHHPNGMLDEFATFPPGLIVDVGAAAGHIASKLLKASPASRAIAFEPFPGNWRFIEQTLGHHPRATIVRKAVADQEGEASFYVSSTAQGAWEAMTGYSSVGYIMGADEEKDASRVIKVPVTTIDSSVSEPIRFLKIDVQGGELAVLRGAEESFARGIDVLYVEFGGEDGILDHLFERDYVVFDHRYVVAVMKDAPDLSFWDLTSELALSNGQKAYYAWPKELPESPAEFSAIFAREAAKTGWIQTDIVAVKRAVAAAKGWI